MKRIIRKDEAAVSPVIATILMVAITVVLAAVLYVMVSGLLVGPGATRPVLQFDTSVPITGGSAKVTIASISQDVARDQYRVNLGVNATTGASIGLAASGSPSNVVVSGITYTVTWTDVGGEGKVTGGDWFTITRSGGLPSATAFTYYLLWAADGSVLQTKTFNTA